MSSEDRADGATVTVRADDLHYSLIIEWDPRDSIYIATVPELPGCRTHGRTYTQAVGRAQQAIESWVEIALADGETLPTPRTFTDWSNYRDTETATLTEEATAAR